MKLFLDSDTETPEFNEEFFHSIVEEIHQQVEFSMETELSVVLTDDASIKELNNIHRGKDSATDVLSFPMFEESMLGDIVISVETAEAQAKDADIKLTREVAFLFIHGFLHLLGYDHEDDSGGESGEAEEMYSLQEDILRQWEKKAGTVG